MTRFLLFIICTLPNLVFGQNTDFKYFRPSLIQVHVPFSDPIIQSDLDKVVLSEITPKADKILITDNSFPNILYPIKPQIRLFKNTRAAKREKLQYENDLKNATQEQIYSVTRQIVGAWFARDNNGNMGDSFLKKKASLTAVQSDFTIAGASEVSKLDEIGYALISKSFINVYNVNSLTSWRDYYNSIDKRNEANANKRGTEFVPEIRYYSGYFLNYDVLLFKMVWDLNTSSDFWTNFYVDTQFNKDEDASVQQQQKNEKIRNFANLKVGANLVSIYSLNSESSSRTNPEYEKIQSTYYFKQTKVPVVKKGAPPAPPIDYEKKGDLAITEGYIGAALDFYNKAYQDAVKAKKDTKAINQKRVSTKIKLAKIYAAFETEFYNDNSKVIALKEGFTGQILNQVYTSMSKDKNLSNDFKISTTVIGNTKTMLKVPVGTKEEIFVGQRYIAYELVNSNGVNKKSFIGYARVTKQMMQNKGMISGIINPERLDSPFEPYSTGYSLFSQQSGEITSGSLLELEPDKRQRFIFEEGLGRASEFDTITNNNEKSIYNSFTVGYGFDARSIWKLCGGSPLMGPENLYISFYFHYILGKKFSSTGYGMGIEKEIYTGLGGLHVIPSLYFGAPFGMRAGIGLGYHLNKNLTFSLHNYFGDSKYGGTGIGLNFKYHY